jgi:acetyl esterase/lipase
MTTMTAIALDPEVASMQDLVPVFTLDDSVLSAVREFRLMDQPELSDRVARADHVVPGRDGDPDITVRVHRTVGAEGPQPCFYSIHGGGYVLGSNVMDDARFDVWCPRFDCVGVSVEYRLAPETPYPGPLEDCYRGLQWVYEHHEELGIDPGHIGIGGVSAGGGLCAALALLVRDRGEIPVRFQLLDCPMLDDRQITVSSNADDLVIWSRESNTYGWRSYLGPLYGTDDVPAYAAAARATDLAGLPPAYVCVGGADGFRDEDIEYAARLNHAGVPAELHVYPGAPHGVMLFPNTTVARRYNRDMMEWLERQLQRT